MLMLSESIVEMGEREACAERCSARSCEFSCVEFSIFAANHTSLFTRQIGRSTALRTVRDLVSVKLKRVQQKSQFYRDVFELVQGLLDFRYWMMLC